MGRQVMELNSVVEYHNFILGCLEFRRIGNSSYHKPSSMLYFEFEKEKFVFHPLS